MKQFLHFPPGSAASRSVLARSHAALALLIVTSLAASAADWPQWRGPDWNGSSPEKGLPATFSKTENVRWTAPMPGPSAATPIIHGERVFISSTDLKQQKLLAMCLDAKTGKELWRQETGEGINRDDRSNFASPSPLTDGRHVWFFYGNGELVAFDLEGRKVWSRNIQKDYGAFAFQWTFSSTPMLYGGKLYVQVLQRNVPVGGRGRTDGPNDSYLLALDPTTGRELWRHVRPADAREESLEAFSTPVPLSHAGRDEILVVGGDCITGHSPADGKELWRWGTWNPTRITHWRLVPSPVAGGGSILACGPKGAPIFAVKAGQKGTLDDKGLAWTSTDREISSDVATPLFYEGRFYILNGGRKTLSRVEPATGKVEWTGTLESRAVFEASPLGADGKIYLVNHTGDVYVVQAGPEFKLLHTTSMGGADDRAMRASFAAGHGSVFLRTAGTLYCLGTPK